MKYIVWKCDNCEAEVKQFEHPQKMPDGWIAIIMKLQESGQPVNNKTKAVHFCVACKPVKVKQLNE